MTAYELLAEWRPDVDPVSVTLVQEGPVLRQHEQGLSCADRFGNFNAGAVGSGDLLVDDATRWAHFRRGRVKP